MQISTNFVVAASQPRMGRPRINGEDEKVTARFPAGTLVRIKAVLREGEPQSALIREAIERELERREKEVT